MTTGADPETAEITYRRARKEDAERTFEIVQLAQGDLDRQAGRTVAHALPAARVIRFRHFCVKYDPDRFWVAEAGGSMVAAGYGVLRDDLWYLGALHVLTEWQGRGIGRELIRRCLAGTGPTTAITVLTDASNPISNGLYMQFGMLPQESTLGFDGPIDAVTASAPSRSSAPASSPSSSSAAAGAATFDVRPIDIAVDQPVLSALDLGSVGFSRPTDHEFWTGVPGLTGVLLVRDGSVRGYAYVSDRGAIGPVAVTRPEEVPAALDRCVEIALDGGATNLHLRLFGATRTGVDWAIRRGLRLGGIGLMLSSRPVGRFEGYVTSGADALY
jgi:ribosomal protein S18 acetylase RimI-like enzyme